MSSTNSELIEETKEKIKISTLHSEQQRKSPKYDIRVSNLAEILVNVFNGMLNLGDEEDIKIIKYLLGIFLNKKLLFVYRASVLLSQDFFFIR